MPFPRNPDNTLNFVEFEMYDNASQDRLLSELQVTGSPADKKQAYDYFEKQEKDSMAKSAQAAANIAVLEKRNAILLSKTSAKIADNIQKSSRKNKGCAIS